MVRRNGVENERVCIARRTSNDFAAFMFCGVVALGASSRVLSVVYYAYSHDDEIERKSKGKDYYV